MATNQVSITQAAEMVGVTRATLYKHIDEKNISVIKEGNAHPKIDVSELIRVYGDNLNMPNATKQKESSGDTNKQKTIQNHGGLQTDSYDAALLRQEVKHLKELKEIEVKRLEDQVAMLEKHLAEEKEEKNKINLLLTDQREKSDKSDYLDKSMKALEERIANQETAAKEEQERAQKILRQNQALKKALEEEKNKSFWQKLFG